jgi:signal transduction histidine kinase
MNTPDTRKAGRAPRVRMVGPDREVPMIRGREAEEIVRAISRGEADAVVIHEGDGQVVPLCPGADDELQRAIRQGEVDAFVMYEGGEEKVHVLSRVEQALRESQAAERAALEHLQLAMTASGAVMWGWQPGTERVHWSPEYRDVYGFAAGEGETFREWSGRIHPDDAGPLLAKLRCLLDDATDNHWAAEFRIVHPTKGVRWLGALGRVSRDADGKATFLRGINLDITDRKLNEELLAAHRDRLNDLVAERTANLTEAHARLRLAERMAAVGTLAAGLAHDMNNALLPLSVRMEGLLAQPQLGAESKEDLTVVVALLDHLKAMSRNLSLFARDPERGGAGGHTDLGQWCTQVRGFIGASMGTDVTVKWDVPAGLPAAAIAPHRLTQAVHNLVQNAREAIAEARAAGRSEPRAGSVTVEALMESAPGLPEPASLMIRVRDNGPGMTDEVRRRSIEPFFTTRERPATPGGAGGTGLGMSLAYAAAVSAGGRMEVQSQPGAGTTVTLVLPVASAEP